MLTLKEKLLTRNKTLAFLEEIAVTPEAEAQTLYLPTGLPQGEITNWLVQIPTLLEASPEIMKIITESRNGAVLFCGSEARFLVLPPFPVKEKSLTSGYYVKPLQALLTHDFKIAIVMVRLGSYAIGICRGEKLASGKVGTGLIHGRHKKGGSSQGRFQRHREKQIESFLTRVCTHVREQLEPETGNLDYLVYGGSWTTILLLQKRCPFLQRLEVPTLPPLTNLPDPRRAVLERAIELVWSCRVIEWHNK
ncbi:Vms1/Ankzf1 family peptidyl-tRNA hydrolase [Chloroflexota bacterium]